MSYFTVDMDEGCQSGHWWNGSSQCSRCYARLRCGCGVYVREDNLDKHMQTCRALVDQAEQADWTTGEQAA